MGGACSTYGGRGEVYTGFWWGKPRDRDHLEDIGVDGRIILKGVLKKSVGRVWKGLVGSRRGRSGALLWMK